MKTIKPPVQTNEIFYGGTASLILASTNSAVLFDIQQGKKVAEINTPPVKYIIWNNDGSLVALLSKHSKHSFLLLNALESDMSSAITIANKNFSQSSLIHETIRIKSGAWDDSGVLIYSTLNHIKYCLPQGCVENLIARGPAHGDLRLLSDTGVIRTLDNPVYLTRIKGRVVHCLDRAARPRTIPIDPTEYRFKLALLKNNYEEMLQIIKTSNLVGQSVIAYLQQKGFPEVRSIS